MIYKKVFEKKDQSFFEDVMMSSKKFSCVLEKISSYDDLDFPKSFQIILCCLTDKSTMITTNMIPFKILKIVRCSFVSDSVLT